MAGPRDESGDSPREAILRRFHAANPGATSAALARAGTYHRLAALVTAGERVLDLGAGDGYLCELLAGRGARAVGVDFSHDELARFQSRVAARPEAPGAPAPCAVAARAQALPFADGSFDACVSHLAFMLMEDAPAVVAELERVLAPGGRFAALLGGGPVAEGPAPHGLARSSLAAPPDRLGPGDAFHRFLAIARPRLRGPRFGDPRAKSERGWRELFAGWTDLAFERLEIELDGPFDEVWRFLGASYELPREDAEAVRSELAASVAELADPQGRVPCRMVTWLGTVRRGREATGRRGRS